MNCDWPDEPPFICPHCGTRRRVRVVRRCDSEERYACQHRGDQSRPVKIECCGGKNRMVDTYRCNSTDVPQRLCILSGTIAQKHERQLVAVCQACEVRQPS